MLSAQQQALVEAIQELDVAQVQQILTDIDANFITEQGSPVSILCDRLFSWWEMICDAYENNSPLSEQEKQQELKVYLDILELLIQAKANLHLWDSEEFYGPLWDAGSAGCVPVLQRLLAEKIDPNTLDDEGDTILSSLSYLFFECDFDEIDWAESYPEVQQTLELLRANGAKMTKELRPN